MKCLVHIPRKTEMKYYNCIRHLNIASVNKEFNYTIKQDIIYQKSQNVWLLKYRYNNTSFILFTTELLMQQLIHCQLSLFLSAISCPKNTKISHMWHYLFTHLRFLCLTLGRDHNSQPKIFPMSKSLTHT